MDAGRLLKTVSDIRADEDNLSPQSHFQKLSTAYTEGQSEIVESERAIIRESQRKSYLWNYVRTDYEILDALGARGYFGEESVAKIDTILRGESHTIKAALASFVQKRQELVTKILGVEKALGAFELESRDLDAGEYQFAFTLPDAYKDLNSLENVLRDLKNFMTAIAVAKKQPADFKIRYVSSSEFQFVIDVTRDFGNHMAVVMDCALRLYGVYGMTKDLLERAGFLSRENKKQIREVTEKEKAEMSEKFADELINELGIEGAESQTSVRLQFAKYLKHMQNGVGTEVRTPSVLPPDEPAEGATKEEAAEQRQLKREYQQKEKIDIKNKEMYILQARDFQGGKLEFLEAAIRQYTADIKKPKRKKSGSRRTAKK